jgi:hypothetical protein
VLCKRFVEVLDGGSQVPGLGVSGSDTTVGLGDDLVIGSDLRKVVVSRCKAHSA